MRTTPYLPLVSLFLSALLLCTGARNFDHYIDSGLKGLPSELNTLKTELFNPVIPSPVMAFSATVPLFGQSATVYLFWEQQGSQDPFLAITLPDVLTLDKMVGGGDMMDIGLSKPVIFWAKEEGRGFAKDSVPTALKNILNDAGAPAYIELRKGFNLLGKPATGFAGDLLSSAPINLDPSDLFAVIAKSGSGYAVSLLLGEGKVWNKPFGLADTKIKSAVLRISSENKVKTVELWGTANLKQKKDFLIYARNAKNVEQSLGFDTKTATLEDFFLILSVASNTLGLGDIPTPTELPLDMVTLENPSYTGVLRSSMSKAFDSMMFKGTKKAVGAGELIVNANAKVFKQSVTNLKLNAAGDHVKGSADINIGLGDLKAASACFYLDVSTTGSPSMGIKAQTVLGDADLKADLNGLELSIPPQCPLKPYGLHAQFTDLSLNSFPLTFTYKDCLSNVIKDGVDAVIDGTQIVGKAAKDHAGKAGSAIGDAAGAVGDAVKDGASAAAGAATDAGKAAAGAASDAGKAAGSAAGSVASGAGKAAGDIGKKIPHPHW